MNALILVNGKVLYYSLNWLGIKYEPLDMFSYFTSVGISINTFKWLE